jgi:hypothetical protein
MKTLLIISTLLTVTIPQIASAKIEKRSQQKPVIFFDLGNVIVDTSNWKDVHYYESTAVMLQDLKEEKVSAGLIINIPESWGATCEEKFARTQQFITEVWRPDAAPFRWEDFQFVLLPPSDALRKPHPYLFLSAMSQVCPRPLLFVGEDIAQVNAAAQLGIGSSHVGNEGDPEFPTAAEMKNLATAPHPFDCDFAALWQEHEVEGGFQGCFIDLRKMRRARK